MTEREPDVADRVLAGMLADSELLTIDDTSEGTVAEMALRLDSIKRIEARLKEHRDAIELALTEAMEEDRVVVPHLGTVVRTEVERARVKPGATNDLRRDLTSAIGLHVALNIRTGEIDELKRYAAEEAVQRVFDNYSITASGLPQRPRDLKRDDYLEYSTGYKITIDPMEDEG